MKEHRLTFVDLIGLYQKKKYIMNYTKRFEDIGYGDLGSVGGKNASLGEMIKHLKALDILVPDGFVVTAAGYWRFLEHNNLLEVLKKILQRVDESNDNAQLKSVGAAARAAMMAGEFPEDLEQEIRARYHQLSSLYKTKNLDVAIRSSATAEDLPTASFAGQQESYLHIHGQEAVLAAIKSCMASLFTDRAIAYRQQKGFDHCTIALSVGIQKMVRSDKASAGVMFTLDTETGFKEAILINSSYGLGESVVKGAVIPDEFTVHKSTLQQGYRSIIRKKLGKKSTKIAYARSGTKERAITKKEQKAFSLTDDEVLYLARMALTIEEYYSNHANKWAPMDIEWAKDGIDKKIYIVQARPETVHADCRDYEHYFLEQEHLPLPLVSGQSIGQKIATGKVVRIASAHEQRNFQQGDVLVTTMTDPDWVPLMKQASAIVTDRGGRTCHAAIVSRELGIPAIIGTGDGTKKLKPGQLVTIDCSKGQTGYVYEGALRFAKKTISYSNLPKAPVALMLNLADPDQAFAFSALPVDGVGLARTEFIISNSIKIHPLAAVYPEKITNKKMRDKLHATAAGYKTPKEFFVNVLAQGIATLAAAFYPKTVIVRFSDFKSNEYANLLGGAYFEPHEANPMLGLRGASRYYSALYRDAFIAECAAFKKARQEMGLSNIALMIPFVRTIAEAHKVLEILKQQGFERGKDSLKIIMMCEIPSNVLLLDHFNELFDGFSIGSNDLTQMILAVDRDSELLAALFDERDEAVKLCIAQAIAKAKKHNKSIGICGQAPSDYPDFSDFLIEQGIDSLSLNPDAIVPFLARFKE